MRAWYRVRDGGQHGDPEALRADRSQAHHGWNSIDSMMGAVSAMTSSKRASGAKTVSANVSTDIPSGTSRLHFPAIPRRILRDPELPEDATSGRWSRCCVTFRVSATRGCLAAGDNYKLLVCLF
jgi:hypothetical protein